MTAEQTIRNSSQLVTLKSGRLAWQGEFPEDKTLLSALVEVLSTSYLTTGGTITRK